MDDRDKLIRLLEHWIDHNRDHVASYREWSGRMGRAGHRVVAEQLALAAERQESLDEPFRIALERLAAPLTDEDSVSGGD